MIAATCGHSASENWEALVFTRQSVTVMVVRKTAIQSIGIPFQTLGGIVPVALPDALHCFQTDEDCTHLQLTDLVRNFDF